MAYSGFQSRNTMVNNTTGEPIFGTAPGKPTSTIKRRGAFKGRSKLSRKPTMVNSENSENNSKASRFYYF